MLAVVTLLGEHGDMYRFELHYSQCTQYCMHELYRLNILCIIMNIIRLLLTIPKALAVLCPTPKVNTRQPHHLKLGLLTSYTPCADSE